MATSKESQEQSQIQTHLHVLIACSATRHTILLLLLLLLLLLHHVIRVHAHCVHADHARVSLGVRIPDLCEYTQISNCLDPEPTVPTSVPCPKLPQILPNSCASSSHGHFPQPANHSVGMRNTTDCDKK